jgi:hypothetical protein
VDSWKSSPEHPSWRKPKKERSFHAETCYI